MIATIEQLSTRLRLEGAVKSTAFYQDLSDDGREVAGSLMASGSDGLGPWYSVETAREVAFFFEECRLFFRIHGMPEHWTLAIHELLVVICDWIYDAEENERLVEKRILESGRASRAVLR